MKKRLLFISPRFLFPADSGGKIRTSQILRGMKGGEFEITLLSPEPLETIERYEDDLYQVADHFIGWPGSNRHKFFSLTRLRHLLSSLPVSVATEISTQPLQLVAAELAKKPDVVVFDFVHSAIYAPSHINTPSVMFTHNVEAEIFRRHAAITNNPLTKLIWRDQLRKMENFERRVLSHFSTVIAVSQRDAEYFQTEIGIPNVKVIPTGTDINFFSYSPPRNSNTLIFTGSMDWVANIDAIQFFMEKIWPTIIKQSPDAKMNVVGRSPPLSLIKNANARVSNWNFTGYVDDVRPYVWSSSVYVIPLRVGGGTRIKVFEAMAMGIPVVSTSIGVEGLGLKAGTHYLNADNAADFSAAVIKLLHDKDLHQTLSRNAREYVEKNFSSELVAKRFEHICLDTAGMSG